MSGSTEGAAVHEPAGGRRRAARGADDSLPADRLVYFSDAVVAIAITLLVLPLVELVPGAVERHESVGDLLAANTEPILAFLLSFVVIARLWGSHHRLFDHVERVGPLMTWINLVWLLTIVALPFPTALIGGRSSDPLTAQLYVAVLAVNLLATTGIAVVIHRQQVTATVDRSARGVRGAGITAALMTVGFVILLVAPGVSFWVMLLLFLSDPIERAVTALQRRRSTGDG